MDRNFEQEYKNAFEAAKGLHDAGNALTKKQMEIVFPQLAESEDERIRKVLINIVKSACSKYGVKYRGDEISEEKLLAYLEKQKINTEGDFGRGYDCGYEACLNSHGAEWFEKQKEPHFTKRNALFDKCVENCDPKVMKKVSDEIDDMLQKEQKPILEVFGFKVGDAVRLKDGDGRKHIIKSFEEVEGLHGPNFYHVEFEDDSARSGIYTDEEYPNGYYTQMEKFKEEQKPAEWSEEDRLHYTNVLEALEYVKGCKSDYDKIEAVKSDIAWLKLLRNRVGKDSLQPHWKPSEEQMKAFKGYIEDSQARAEAAVGGWNNFDVMIRLYEQLKHLRD